MLLLKSAVAASVSFTGFLQLAEAALSSEFGHCSPADGQVEYTACKLYEQYSLRQDAVGATTLAYLYGFPLTQFAKAWNTEGDFAAANNLETRGRLFEAGDTDVVRPNIDTNYGRMFFDLSQDNLVVTVPQFETDRFTLIAFYDPYGDSFSSIGTGYSWPPGQYLVQPAVHGDIGIKECAGYAGCVYSPTLNGFLIVRIEVRNNTTDLAYSNTYVQNMTVTTISHEPLASALTGADFSQLPQSPAEQTMTLLARLAVRNQPKDTTFSEAIATILQDAGIRDGSYSKPANVNLTAVEEYFNNTLNIYGTNPITNLDLGNDWKLIGPATIGSYVNGTDILGRSFFAYWGYLMNHPNEALYPAFKEPVINIQKDESVLITFSKKPVLDAESFWSLTLYDEDGWLIENPQKVYGLGDRSLNMTYPDGVKVYGGDAHADGPFQVLVQSTSAPPPMNWTANWLPSPAEGGDVQLTLRFYNPSDVYLNGTYEYPVFTKQAAITE